MCGGHRRWSPIILHAYLMYKFILSLKTTSQNCCKMQSQADVCIPKYKGEGKKCTKIFKILVTHDSFHLSTLTQLSFCPRHPQEKLFLPLRAAAAAAAQPCQVEITSVSAVTGEPEGLHWAGSLEPILSFYSAEMQKCCFPHIFLKSRQLLIRLFI